MSRPPPHHPDDARRIAAFLGGMLYALLAALLGAARGGACAAPRGVAAPGALQGVIGRILRATEEAELEMEPEVEWIAVPAPWRNGRLLRPWHARVPRNPVPAHRKQPGTLLHGPPARHHPSSVQ